MSNGRSVQGIPFTSLYSESVNRWDFQELSKVRLREARYLLEKQCFDGAYYLAGYAVECGLKACIAREIRRYDFPDKSKVDQTHTHNIRQLVRVAGLEDARTERAMSEPDFDKNWVAVERWSPLSRYRRNDSQDAHTLWKAVNDRKNGVMSWIKAYW